MSAPYDPTDALSQPFDRRVRRLECAVWAPKAVDAIVVAHKKDCMTVPDTVRRGTPVIVAFRAAELLWSVVPSGTMAV